MISRGAVPSPRWLTGFSLQAGHSAVACYIPPASKQVAWCMALYLQLEDGRNAIQVEGCFCHWLRGDGNQPTMSPGLSLPIFWARANYPGMTAQNLPPIQALVLVIVGQLVWHTHG